MKDILKILADGRRLTFDEAHRGMSIVMNGEATEAQIGAYLMLLRQGGGPFVEEIAGSAAAMREKVVRIATDPASQDLLIDTCGTGGSGLKPFNISTATAFVLAAGGLKVAKHGNRGVSSTSGSADVLMTLGVNIDVSPEVVGRCVDEIGVGYLFAPKLHPAMKYAIGPRREIGLRTIFNVLGPLTNPAGVSRQVMGVFDESLVELLAKVLAELGTRRAMVVHGGDGLDEITVTATTTVGVVDGAGVRIETIDPADFGIDYAPLESIQVDDPETSARYVLEVLQNKPGPRRDIVALNAAAGFVVGDKADDLKQGYAMALERLASGRPAELLERLVEMTKE